MWVIPKNLHTSLYVQDMEGLTLDSSELSIMCEQSLMWRSKLSNVRTWSQRWKRVGWMQHLFGRILKPSHGQAFVEKWTFSVGASLVNPSQVQAEGMEMKTRATFGHTSNEGFNSVDHPLFSWKTLKDSSPQDFKATNGAIQKRPLFCYMSFVSWSDWVTQQRQAYFQRVRWERHTREKDFSLWAVKKILIDQDLTGESCLVCDLQQAQIKNNLDMNQPEHKRWPTPLVGDANSTHLKIAGIKKRQIEQRQISLSMKVSLLQNTHAPPINPRWVDCLMGLPIGWTCPSFMELATVVTMNCAVLGMESYQPQPAKRLKHSSILWPTPTAKQRGDRLKHYLARCKKFMSENKPYFAPTLQVQVEAEEKGIDIKQELEKLKHD